MKRKISILFVTGFLCLSVFLQGAAGKNSDRANSYYHYMRGSLKEASRDYQGAIEEYKKALKFNPDASEIFSRLAYLYVQTNRLEDAIKDVQKAIEKDPDNKEAHRMLGQIYLEKFYQNEASQADLQKALQEFQEVRRIDPDEDSVLLTLGQLYLQTHQPARAVEPLTQYIQKNPDSPSAVMSVAAAYQQLKQPEKAVEFMQKYLEMRPDNYHVLRQAANLYEEMGNVARALELQRRLYQADSSNREVVLQYISLLEKNKRYEEAIAVLKEKIQNDPENREWSAQLAVTLQKAGQQERAEKLMKEILQEDPDNLEFQLKLLEIYEEGRRFQEANQLVTELIQKVQFLETTDETDKNSTQAVLYSHMGYIAQQEKRYEDAIRAYRQARQFVQPREAERVDFRIALVLRNMKRYDEAIELLNSVVRVNPNNQDGWELLSLLYEEKGDSAGSDRIIQHLIAMNPDSPEYYLLKAERLQERFQYQDSIDLLKGLQSRFPDQDQIYFLLGAASERLKKYDQAEEYFRKTIQLNPNNANAWNYLGYMWIDQGVRIEESIEYIKKALEIDGDNGAYLDSLGWGYFKLNQLELAEDNLRMAVERLSDNPVVHDHMGDLYFKMGKFQEAIRHWETALRNKSHEIDPRFIQKKIDDTKNRLD